MAMAIGASLPIVSQQASAVAQVDLDVVTAAGANRFDTAAKIAEATFAPGGCPAAAPVQHIVLATGRNFPDALAANALAGAVNAPILLTEPNDLPDETLDAIECLHNPDGSTTVHVVGGPSAVGQGVRDELAGLPVQVTDEDAYNGRDRYLTAIKVARTLDDMNVVGTTTTGKKTVFLTTGENFADAVAAGPLAFYGKFPVLLIPSNADPTGALMDELLAVLDELEVDSVIILGGPNAVSTDIEDKLDQHFFPAQKVDRIGGATRIETAALLATWAQDELDWIPQTVLLARADDFADALAGGPHGGQPSVKAPVLLTSRSGLSEGTRNWLDQNDRVIRLIRRLGGDAAVPRSVAEEARMAAQTQDINMLGAESDAPELQYVRLVNDPTVPDSALLLEYVFDQPVEAVDFADPGFLFSAFRLYLNNCLGTRLEQSEDPEAEPVKVPVATTSFVSAINTSIVGNGNVVRARFPVTVESGTRATVVRNAVQNDQGLFNIEGAYPIRPTLCPDIPAVNDRVLPRLVRVTNWQSAPFFVGDNRVSVDFWFENPNDEALEGANTGAFGDYPAWLLGQKSRLDATPPNIAPGETDSYRLSNQLANQFWLVGDNSSIWQGDTISIPGTEALTVDGVSYYRVRVFFNDEVVPPNAGALRRGFVADNDGLDTGIGVGPNRLPSPDPAFWTAAAPGYFTGLGMYQAANYFTTTGQTGITVDPDLVDVAYVGTLSPSSSVDVFEFTFDEAVSSVQLDNNRFAIYDEYLAINRPNQVVIKAGTGNKVVQARYNSGYETSSGVGASVGLSGRLMGGFVEDSGVRGTDTFLGINNGFNRPDEAPLTFALRNEPSQEGVTIQAGYTMYPDLKMVVRLQDSVTGNFQLAYIFDQTNNYGICAVQDVSLSVWDPQGVRTRESVIPFSVVGGPLVPAGQRRCFNTPLGPAVVVDGGLGAPVINNDHIETGVVAGVTPSIVDTFPSAFLPGTGLDIPRPFLFDFLVPNVVVDPTIGRIDLAPLGLTTEGSALVFDVSDIASAFALQRFPSDPETHEEGTDWEVVEAQPGT